MSSNWRNRIVSHSIVNPKDLVANPLNYKDHPDYQKRIMSATLDEIGWIGEIVVNVNTGNMIDGHMRVFLALDNDELEVPVSYVDLTEEEEQKALATFDPIGNFAKENADRIKTLVSSLTFRNLGLSDMAMKIAQENGSMRNYGEEKNNTETENIGSSTGVTEQKDLSEIDKKTNDYSEKAKSMFSVEYGQVWQLGNHVLICGDCEDKLIYSFATHGKKVSAINTDPPYGIDIVGSDGRIGYAAKFGDIEGDKKPFDPTFLMGWSDNITLWGANHYSHKLPSSSCWLVWDKREGDRQNDQADCELAWCTPPGVVRIFHHLWMGFARASERNIQRIHPTQKPVALIAWSIMERTKEKDLILDPYCGSGTTIIASEQTGRICIGIEKIPSYVASSLLRFQDQTKIEPQLVKTL